MCNLPRSLLSDVNNHVSTSAGLTSELGFSQVFAEESRSAKGEQRAWYFRRCGQPPSARDCIWLPYLCVFRAKTRSVSVFSLLTAWYELIKQTSGPALRATVKGVLGNSLAVVSLTDGDFTNVWGQINLSLAGGRLDMRCSPARVRQRLMVMWSGPVM